MNKIDRRSFIKLSSVGAGSLMARTAGTGLFAEFQPEVRLGRTTTPQVNVRVRPDISSQIVQTLPEDDVVVWNREVVGSHPYRINQKWVETPQGYIWGGNLQPVENLPNIPLENLPVENDAEGMWAEVTVPWVDLTLDNPPARSPWLKENPTPRLYYSQILWVDEIRAGEATGKTLYRLNEKFGYGDILLANAEAFRPISEEEIEPIRPDIENKRVVVNLLDQSLSCYEGSHEVYFGRISSGAKFDSEGNPVDEWATPLGPHPTWRKLISTHMSGGTTGGGYDLPGIGWTTLFVGNGVAIHSTFWHNNFGVPMSHGCVNAKPEDAKWIFRWTTPLVPYFPGDVTVSMPGGTRIEVVEI